MEIVKKVHCHLFLNRITLTLFRVHCHFLDGRLILDEFHQPFLLIDCLPKSWDQSWDTDVVQAYLW